MAFADKDIRDNRIKLNRRIRNIVRRFNFLDDPRVLIEMTDLEIRATLRKYKMALMDSLNKFFLGKSLDKAIIQASKEFNKATKGINKKNPKLDKITNQVKFQFNQQITNIVNEIIGRQTSKISQFKLMVESARPTTKDLINLIPKNSQVLINGKVYDLRTIKDQFNVFTKRFGSHATMLFRNGTKYPLKAWVEGKTMTVANDVNRVTTTIEALNNDILTGKVSSHGSTDSCIYHEGEIVFFSESSKRQFLRQFPDVTQAKRWRTIQELEADNTHIFSFNCKHTVTPFPIQYQSEKDIEKEAESAKVNKVPKKINESKLKEELSKIETGKERREFASAG